MEGCIDFCSVPGLSPTGPTIVQGTMGVRPRAIHMKLLQDVWVHLQGCPPALGRSLEGNSVGWGRRKSPHQICMITSCSIQSTSLQDLLPQPLDPLLLGTSGESSGYHLHVAGVTAQLDSLIMDST